MPTIKFDFGRIYSAIYRNRWIVGGIIVVALLVGILLTTLATPIYSAVSTVQIETQVSSVLPTKTDEAAASVETDKYLQTQTDIVASRLIAGRVAEALGLYRSDRFFAQFGMEPPVSPEAGRTLAETKRRIIEMVLQKNVSTSLPRNSQIVLIRFVSPDAALSAAVANSYAENLISSNLQRRFDSSAYAREFLQNQLAQVKNRLEASERAQIAYARRAGLIDTARSASTEQGAGSAGGAPASLVTANLIQLNTALTAARAERIAAETRWKSAQGQALGSLPEVRSDAAIENLTRELAVARATLQRDSERYRADHPTIEQERAQVASLTSQIATLSQNVRNGLRERYEVALAAQQQLEQQVNRFRTDTLAEQDRGVQYNILSRETRTNRDMYDALLQRYKEVSAEAGITTNNISIVDRAEVPTAPFSPRPLVNLLLALAAGIALAGIAVAAIEILDDAARVPDDIPGRLGIPLLGSIPVPAADTTPAEALSQRRSAFTEAFASLRTSLALMSSGGLMRSVVVTSGREAEGKSTTAYGIARSFAQAGSRVVLVDCDLRRPSVHRLVDIVNDTGTTTLLTSQSTLENTIHRSNVDNLDIITSGPIPPSPAELIDSDAFKSLLADLESRYDLVVIDSPPVLGLADALLLSRFADRTVYVVQAGRRRSGQGAATVRRLVSGGGRIDGGVLTMFDPKVSGYGYEYGYYYTYGNAATAT